jgi:hypothetical protein
MGEQGGPKTGGGRQEQRRGSYRTRSSAAGALCLRRSEQHQVAKRFARLKPLPRPVECRYTASWRNWQTRWTQNPVPQGVWVRVPPGPLSSLAVPGRCRTTPVLLGFPALLPLSPLVALGCFLTLVMRAFGRTRGSQGEVPLVGHAVTLLCQGLDMPRLGNMNARWPHPKGCEPSPSDEGRWS